MSWGTSYGQLDLEETAAHSHSSMGELREAGQWVLDREIGSGSFAKVWRATHKQTQQVAAVKEINLDKLSKKLQESLASEVAVLKHTQHHNIVCLVDLIKVGVDVSCSLLGACCIDVACTPCTGNCPAQLFMLDNLARLLEVMPLCWVQMDCQSDAAARQDSAAQGPT